jgi:hypothetical protein
MKTAEEFEESIKARIAKEKVDIKECQDIIDGGCNNDEEEIGYGENIYESEIIVKALEEILND